MVKVVAWVTGVILTSEPSTVHNFLIKPNIFFKKMVKERSTKTYNLHKELEFL